MDTIYTPCLNYRMCREELNKVFGYSNRNR